MNALAEFQSKAELAIFIQSGLKTLSAEHQDSFSFHKLQAWIENQLGTELPAQDIIRVKKALASLNQADSKTCSALPFGWRSSWPPNER